MNEIGQKFKPPEYTEAEQETDKKNYPMPSFYFKVDCGFNEEFSFQEVSGLTYELSTTEFTEGGENKQVYHLPGTRKYSNLKVKRGVIPKNTGLIKWCMDVLEGEFENPIESKTIIVSLLDIDAVKKSIEPVCIWNCFNAFPVKWEIDSFSSMDNKIAVETIEFQYTHMERQK